MANNNIARYSRGLFYGTMTNNEGIVLTDPIEYDFQEFIEFMRNKRVKVIRINEADEFSPDLLSYAEYGTHEFWWVICYLNKIQDPLNELQAGMEIAIPLLKDIEEFKQSRNTATTRGQSVVLN